MKILIIEDSHEVAETVSFCLQLGLPGVEINIAAEGGKGINLLKSSQFDLAILDINLPDIDGFQVLREVRSFSNVPIIILTVRGNDEDKQRGLNLGANDYINKPFRPRDLIERTKAVSTQNMDICR